VLEAQKLKRLWPLSALAPFDGCKTPKEQQPSFLLGQLQFGSFLRQKRCVMTQRVNLLRSS
jgi:hypothetical protein